MSFLEPLDVPAERPHRSHATGAGLLLSKTMEVILTHVLIIIGWLGGAVNGPAVSTQEFASAERCEAARLALTEHAKARGFEDALRPFCLQK